MLASLALLTLAPAAPVPKAPPPAPPVEVLAKRYVHPPRVTDLGWGRIQVVNVDDGHYIEVSIRNTSKETLSFDTRHELTDRVYVKITDEKGNEVTRQGYHLMMLCSSRSEAVEVKPGEWKTVVVHLFRDWPARKAGKYTARVLFTSGKVKAESETTFELEVK